MWRNSESTEGLNGGFLISRGDRMGREGMTKGLGLMRLIRSHCSCSCSFSFSYSYCYPSLRPVEGKMSIDIPAFFGVFQTGGVDDKVEDLK